MDRLKFILFSIVVLAILGLIGYWSVVSLETGPEHVVNQELKELKKENKDLKNEVADLKKEIDVYKVKLEKLTLSEKTSLSEPKVEEVVTNISSVSQYEDLINRLQKLVDQKISMKLKSRGTRVGTVQEFLNIYNNTSTRIDNDYGAGTKKKVNLFQKDQGLHADGEAGPKTFSKMIKWLKKQN